MLRRKPILCSTVRILRLFEVGTILSRKRRGFTWSRPLENHENESDIADWVKESLSEPIPSQHFQERLVAYGREGGYSQKCLIPSLTIVSTEEYINKWHTRFAEADLHAVNRVLQGLQTKTRVFTLPHLMTLLRSLRSIRRYYEIHEIYHASEECLPLMADKTVDDATRQEFLKIVIEAEDILGDYKLCERLFSDYIKFPRLNRHIISVGLKSFLRNDNLQLAKQFFMQALENPETFPVTKVEFKAFCLELSQLGDLDSMLFVFKLWAVKRCSGSTTCCDPDLGTISLFHRLFIQCDDRKGLERFLNDEVIKRTGYERDVIFQTTEFCQNLHQTKKKSFPLESFKAEKIDQLLTLLEQRADDRRHFYLNLLNALVLGDDFHNIRHVIGKVQRDEKVQLDGSFHHTIAKFFVRNGMLSHMIQYYSDVVLNRTAGRIRLKVSHVEQLWNCALQAYPSLTREITNELKVILDKKRYLKLFPQLQQVIKQASKIRKRKTISGEEYSKCGLPQVDFERLRRFESSISNEDVPDATSSILESLKRGTKPHFDFYLCAIRKCLSSSLPNLAKILSEMLSKQYKVPVKLNILWLRNDICSKYRSTMSEAGTLSSPKSPLLETQLREFERTNRESLNFQNYLQLSQIGILIRDYNQAKTLLEEAAHAVDPRSRHQWLMYYMTSLQLSARLHKPDEFLALLKEWNQNDNAKLISRGSIRQVKAYSRLFDKKLDHSTGCFDAVLTEITKEIDILVERYVAVKFQGLNESRKLYVLLKRWLDQEIRELTRLERKRRKALTPTAYSDKA